MKSLVPRKNLKPMAYAVQYLTQIFNNSAIFIQNLISKDKLC